MCELEPQVTNFKDTQGYMSLVEGILNVGFILIITRAMSIAALIQ